MLNKTRTIGSDKFDQVDNYCKKICYYFVKRSMRFTSVLPQDRSSLTINRDHIEEPSREWCTKCHQGATRYLIL